MRTCFRSNTASRRSSPDIARYFPNARVAAVAVGGEPPVNQSDAEKLTSALAPYFTRRNRKYNFLLISTDFSHLSGIKETARKDASSRVFFDAPSKKTWIYAVCDNRPGIYALAHLIDEVRNAPFCFTRHRTNFREKAKTTLQVIIFRCFIKR
nr:hypothetical protein [Treponema socranskii]